MPDITLAALHRALPGDLVAFPEDAEVPPVPISAVHVSELEDPSQYLEGGEFLLTTGLTAGLSAAWFRAYFERLRQARIAGLALGLGPRFERVPRGFAAAAPNAGFPLFVVPAQTRFLTITRRYWEISALPGRRRVADALAGYRALVEATTRPDPETELIRRLAAAVGGWVAHLSAQGAPRSVFPASARVRVRGLRADIARLAGAGLNAAATLPLDDDIVLVHPLGGPAGDVTGYVVVGSPQALTAEQRHLVLAAVAVLSSELAHRHRVRVAERAARTPVLRLLLGGQPLAARLLAELVAPEVLEGTYRPAALTGPPPVLAQLAQLCGGDERCLLLWPEPATVRLLLGDRDEGPAWLGALVRDAGAAAAIGPPVGFDTLPAAFETVVHRAATAEPGTVDDYLAAAPDSLLAQLEPGLLTSWAARRLGAVPEYDRAQLVPALAGYLRHGGNWEAAARELGTHRHTLRHRVRRAGELLGVDVADADVRAELWLALRATGRT